MANGYLQGGRVLFHDTGAFRIGQRSESLVELACRMERLNNELCVLPLHPGLQSDPNLRFIWAQSEAVGEICLVLVKTVAIINGQPWTHMV